ncbi:glycoside hydrolase family 5 protein [Phanerochaete carnosa HHB-10118-sp]|uniref:Glycoside hydrolase family 5 protein n=1 Tax=Phanerochaete carnosa (strain HHB-10118-sp) TaxID=650164 RepID=K5WE82_PHACS|nr:glycoside hydrolase family 5 protein [Phanerochaete carnosa HHB-10118-sp]EKM57344.1 glycoside hydrolase family 5 protein [Phanerochaete carnosa HHB-10118-sp]
MNHGTCFWVEDAFTPKLRVKDAHGAKISIQQFLQASFLNSWEMLAKAVGDLDGVIGFEIMNEPHRGYVELQSMQGFDYNADLHLGPVPTPLQSFTLGAGHPTEVGVWTRSFLIPTRRTSQVILNKADRKIWYHDGPTGERCIWEMLGIWGWDCNKKEGIVPRENHFKKHSMTNAKVDWCTAFYFPFLEKWAHLAHSMSNSDKMIFAEAIPNGPKQFCPTSWTPEHRPRNMVCEPHWYDLNALFTKGFGDFSVDVQGLSRGAWDKYALHTRNIAEEVYRSLGEKPVVIGECGVPMDMNGEEAFKSEGFTWQLRMFDAMSSESGITSRTATIGRATIGTARIFHGSANGAPSLLDCDRSSPTLDNGARILRSVVRPYPSKAAGIPLRFEYEVNTGEFTFEWAVPGPSNAPSEQPAVRPSVHRPPLAGHPPLTSHVTEIFVPSFLALGGAVVMQGLAEGGSYEYDEARQTLYVRAPADAASGTVHRIRVVLAPRLKAVFLVNDFWSDWGSTVAAVAAAVLALWA